MILPKSEMYDITLTEDIEWRHRFPFWRFDVCSGNFQDFLPSWQLPSTVPTCNQYLVICLLSGSQSDSALVIYSWSSSNTIKTQSKLALKCMNINIIREYRNWNVTLNLKHASFKTQKCPWPSLSADVFSHSSFNQHDQTLCIHHLFWNCRHFMYLLFCSNRLLPLGCPTVVVDRNSGILHSTTSQNWER